MKALAARLVPKAFKAWWRYKFLDRWVARAVVKRLKRNRFAWEQAVKFVKGPMRHEVRLFIDHADGDEDRLVHFFDALAGEIERRAG